MTLGVDECWFPERAAMTAYTYGCRCVRCTARRKRYDAKRSHQPRRRVQPKGVSEQPRRQLHKVPRPERAEPYMGPCRCETPHPESLGAWGGHQCSVCGMPIWVTT